MAPECKRKAGHKTGGALGGPSEEQGWASSCSEGLGEVTLAPPPKLSPGVSGSSDPGGLRQHVFPPPSNHQMGLVLGVQTVSDSGLAATRNTSSTFRSTGTGSRFPSEPAPPHSSTALSPISQPLLPLNRLPPGQLPTQDQPHTETAKPSRSLPVTLC